MKTSHLCKSALLEGAANVLTGLEIWGSDTLGHSQTIALIMAVRLINGEWRDTWNLFS